MNRKAPAPSDAPTSKFTRLAITHALMMGGDAAMVVALADSFFFSVELDAARTQVLLFLAVSFAPFLFIAPLIGPLIDRMAGGRRLVIQIVALSRVVLLVLMAMYLDGLALFPLVFASLVLQKTYTVSKSSLVPSTVHSKDELVEANSKLGLVAGLIGAATVIPAVVLFRFVSSPAALIYGALLFGTAFLSARRLAPEVIAAQAVGEEEQFELRSPSLQLGAAAMTVLRANVGFTFFHLAFWLRTFDNGTVLFGAAIGASALATLTGNALAPRVRRMMKEETMLSSALIISAAAGIGLAVVGGPAAGIALAAIVNFVASLGRLGFESIVQRDAPEANQGRAFATFETRFQLAWAVAAFLAVAIQAPGAIGLLIVGLGAIGMLVHTRIRQQRPDLVRRRRPSKRRRRRPPQSGARSGPGRNRSRGNKGRGNKGRNAEGRGNRGRNAEGRGNRGRNAEGRGRKRPPTRRDQETREPTRGQAPRSRSASERPPDQ